MKGIYIIGQTERTGTNFLFKVIQLHSDIAASSQPGEDRLLMESDHLVTYVDRTSGQWNNAWKGMDREVYKAKLLGCIQSALLSYLQATDKIDKVVLTKSPTTIGIDNFFKLFPNYQPIILVRDGRNVVESWVQSFGREYKDAMSRWAESAQRIRTFIEQHPTTCVVP